VAAEALALPGVSAALAGLMRADEALVVAVSKGHDGDAVAAVERRDLPAGGVDGAWLHVRHQFRCPTQGVAEWARAISALDAEVCCSTFDPDAGEYYTLGEGFTAVLFAGAATAHYEYDCWSCVCPVTGRRFASRDWAYSTHDEAWVNPRAASVAAFITNSQRDAAALTAAGFTVVFASAAGMGMRAQAVECDAGDDFNAPRPIRVRGMTRRDAA